MASPAGSGSASGQIWLDGRLLRTDEPHLHVSDRGFQLGDGVFETMRARRGVVVELDEHLVRLHESASIMAIPIDATDEPIVRGMVELLGAEGLDGTGLGTERPGDAAIRVTVTRGAIDLRGLLPTGWRTTTPTVAIQAWPYAPPAAALLERGVRAIASRVRHDSSSPLAGVKSTSRADHVYAKLEAERAGVDDALFLTLEGAISEASTANVFTIVGQTLLTPPRSAGILAGTTRTWLLAHAAESGLVEGVVEQELMPDDLLRADEAFVSSSVAGIVPLVEYEGRRIGDGRPGSRTLALRAARERWIDERSLERVRGEAAASRSPRHAAPARVEGDA